MSIAYTRPVGRTAVVCLVVAFVFVVATVFASHAAAGTITPLARTRHAVERSTTSLVTDVRARTSSSPLMLRAEGRSVMAYAPPKSAARPLTVVYLHGMHGRAENGCPWFRGGASDLGWLVCPEAAERLADGSWSWGADVFAQAPIVRRSIRAAEAEGASAEPGVAIGFSQGSYVALDLLKAGLVRFRGLVLLGAELHPNVQRLRDAGVARIALGAGSLDGAHASLVDEARRMRDEGIEARFFELGAVGHTYAAEDPESLREAIAWAGGRDE